ncbi:hypothetical protein Ddc_17740 [Ditylenchus destructor]|nr:hypothetical protein Ddc_17740 [Ditylenchus destructor]
MVNIYVFALLLISMSYLSSAENETGEKLCKTNDDCGHKFHDEKPWCLKGKCEGCKNDSDCKSDVCTSEDDCKIGLKYEKPMCIRGKCKGCKNQEDCKSLFGDEKPECYDSVCGVCNVSNEEVATDYCGVSSKWVRPMCIDRKCEGCNTDDDCVRMLGPQISMCGTNPEANVRNIHSCFERQCPPDTDCDAFCHKIFGNARSKWYSGTHRCVECRFDIDCWAFWHKDKPICKRWGDEPEHHICIPGECKEHDDCAGKDGKNRCFYGK